MAENRKIAVGFALAALLGSVGAAAADEAEGAALDSHERAALDQLEAGIAQFKDNDFDGARQAFIRARDLAPKKPNPHRWLALTDSQLGRCNEALLKLAIFLRLVPSKDPRTAEAVALRDRCQAELRAAPTRGRSIAPASTPSISTRTKSPTRLTVAASSLGRAAICRSRKRVSPAADSTGPGSRRWGAAGTTRSAIASSSA